MLDPTTVYERSLPTGGYVRVDGYPLTSAHYRAVVRVERRGDPNRRFGHQPPVVAEADGASPEGVLDGLLAIAANNVALATAILRWQAARAEERAV